MYKSDRNEEGRKQERGEEKAEGRRNRRTGGRDVRKGERKILSFALKVNKSSELVSKRQIPQPELLI